MEGIIEERKQISNLEFKCCLSIQGFTVDYSFGLQKLQIYLDKIKQDLTKANQAINNVYIRRNSTLPAKSSLDKFKRIKGKVKSALVLISIEKNCK